uniref:Membrane transporter protein n=1 Tax=Arcella intermedia TaxID=1963864 RepID=A0A6B2L2X6_9EUKA
MALVAIVLLGDASAASQGQPEVPCTDSHVCAKYNLVCILNGTNSSHCGHCIKGRNGECEELYGSEYECSDDGACKRKALWPLDWHDYATLAVLMAGGVVAAGGGIGGGGVFIPVLILLGGFKTSDAIPLSNVMIFGSSMASMFLVLRQSHPHADKPLIEYDLAMVMQPLALSGTVVGVVLNTVFPDWVVLILLILVLLSTTYRTTLKGVKEWKKEREGAEEEEEDPLMENSSINVRAHTEVSVRKLQSMYEDEKRNPFMKQLILLSSLILVVVHSLFIGGRGKSVIGIGPCSALYWSMFMLIFPILFLITFMTVRYLLLSEKLKKALDYKYLPGDIHWNKKNSGIISLLSFGAGILSSLLGIGGGMILSPLMLELNVLPAVTAATSVCMIFFTSSSASVQYAILSRILWDYGGVLFVIGLFSGIIGQLGLSWIVKKYKKMSLIIFTVVLIIGCSTILLGVTGGLRVLNKMRHSAYMGFNHYCPS